RRWPPTRSAVPATTPTRWPAACSPGRPAGCPSTASWRSTDVGELRFHTTLIPHGPATAIVLDEAQVAELGAGAKRFPVVGTGNEAPGRRGVARMGGEYLVGLSKAVREAAGVGLESEVDVVLELDTKPREVEVPPALAAALAEHPDLQAKFEK